MGMNIKSERAHELAKTLARTTGESMTAVVEAALEEKLARTRREMDVDERMRKINEIVRRSGPTPPGLTSNHSDLYDDDGLPA